LCNVKRAWAVAKEPIQNIIMTAVLLWMVVSSLNIFTIGILTMSLKTPITQIMSVGSKFERYKDKKHSIILQQLCYLCLSLLISFSPQLQRR